MGFRKVVYNKKEEKNLKKVIFSYISTLTGSF